MTSFVIKLIAVLAMLIDHTGAVLGLFSSLEIEGFVHETDFFFMRGIGRMAMPLFAFLVAMGARHTSSLSNYLKRLIIFAVISEIPHNIFINIVSSTQTTFSTDILMYPYSQNIFWVWFSAVLAMYCLDRYNESQSTRKLLSAFGLVAIFLASELLMFDYGSFGVIIAVAIYIIQPKEGRTSSFFYFVVIVLMLSSLYSSIYPSYFTMFAALAGYLTTTYNGSIGGNDFINTKGKWLFYAFYPVHYIVLSAWALYVLS